MVVRLRIPAMNLISFYCGMSVMENSAIYIDGRIFFKSAGNKRIYPHVGLRLGGALVSEGSSGFYGALSGGVRVAIGRPAGRLHANGRRSKAYPTTGWNMDAAIW